jgi:hypothetical protein
VRYSNDRAVADAAVSTRAVPARGGAPEQRRGGRRGGRDGVRGGKQGSVQWGAGPRYVRWSAPAVAMRLNAHPHQRTH